MFPSLALACTLLAPANDALRVDGDGVLRWESSGDEVALFGVNYYAPFVFEYAELTSAGADIHPIIERDLDQLRRLGLDLIRIHCFDREFSDASGGLVENDHVELLDFLIAEAKERGIYTLLTPIAWWPTPNDIGGFSSHISMAKMTTDPDAWAIQARFLREFVEHRNPHTGLTYGGDPAVVGFEIINEPVPPVGTSDAIITEYINTEVRAIRGAGCAKPIFYNGWVGRHRSVADSEADGCSFGWYPTGLGNGSGITSDCLSAVDRYPEAEDPVLDGLPKMVYEFDAADTVNGVLYPAMARSLRAAGIQLAAQFQYDATPSATHNAAWPTHYLNLAYAPHRAVAMMVAGEAFRRLPRGGEYGRHPEADSFGPFRVSHEEDLAEMLAEDAFLYSADTVSEPPASAALRHIAGVGSSPLVAYEGTGAYFLDRLAPGLWRLEVYPDCAWVDDPFGARAPRAEVSRVLYRSRRMGIRLPDLADGFRVEGPDGPGPDVGEGGFAVTPGVWVLRAPSADARPTVDWKSAAPEETKLPPIARLETPRAVPEGKGFRIEATVVGPEDAAEVEARIGGSAITLDRTDPYRFAGVVPDDLVRGSDVELRAQARFGNEMVLFGGGRVLAAGLPPEPARLLDPNTLDQGREYADSPSEGATCRRQGDELVLSADRFGLDREWLNCRLPVELPTERLDAYDTLRIRCERRQPATKAFEIALVDGAGGGYGAVAPLPAESTDVDVPLAGLAPLWHTEGRPFDLARTAFVNLGMGPYTVGQTGEAPHGFAIASVELVRSRPAWKVRVHPRGAPVALVQGGVPSRSRLHGDPVVRITECTGMDPGRTAFRLEAESFPAGSCTSLEANLGDATEGLASVLGEYTTLVLRMRGAAPGTDACEVVLSETDGAPWGTVVELTEQWAELRVPLSDLRYFSHWSCPEGRGAEGDRLHPERLRSLHLTFGAWLFPDALDQPHAIEVDYVGLEP